MRRISKFIVSQPMRLIITIFLAFYLNFLIPLHLKQFFLSISITLKEFLMFMIPFIIFSSVYKAFAKIRGHAILFIILLLASVIASNFLSVNIAGIFSYFLIFNGQSAIHNPIEISTIEPLWNLPLPKLIPNNIALFLSLILAYIKFPTITKFADKIADVTSNVVDVFLKKIFIPLLPLFIFGFMIKLLTEDIIGDVIAVNPKAFLFMILVLWAYLIFIFSLAVVFYRKKPMDILRNILAPALTAFTSMSSIAALPFSINAAEKNTGNKSVADVVMPATVGIHMIGDSICIPILAMILLMAFGHEMPNIENYLIFAVAFTLTKFSGSGVPGGSILVMIPVLETYLGFTPEMTALITICYMLIDPITTSGNVIGNNIFVMHFNKLYSFLSKR